MYSTTVRIRHGSISVDFSFEAQAIRRVCGGLQTVDRQRGGRSMRGCQERVVYGEGGRDMFSVTCRTVGLTKNAVGFYTCKGGIPPRWNRKETVRMAGWRGVRQQGKRTKRGKKDRVTRVRC